MSEFEIIKGGRRDDEADKYNAIVKDFTNRFKTILTTRGVLSDFSLARVVEEVSDGVTDFVGHEKEVFDKIKDLFEHIPPANESSLPIPPEESDIEMAA